MPRPSTRRPNRLAALFYAWNQLQGEAGLSLTDPLFGRW
jgi:hypothetical protein